MSDFLGNTIVTGSEVELGHLNATELKLLQRSALIPIDTLMKVDKASSLYNEKDRASIFYAEAWALVHYLSLDPEGSKNEPLIRYLKAYEESDDASAGARQAFGDLGELERKLQHYAGQKTFRSQKLKSALALSETDFVLRGISRAEALVTEADFLQHNLHEKEARPLLTEAMALEPKLAALHAYLGYVKYIHFYDEEAEKEFTEAEKLDPKDFRPAFYLAELNYRKKGFTAQMTPRIVAGLEQALQLNDSFAPAYAFLSIAYLQEPETRPKALDAALKASALEPTSMAYAVNAANALMLMNREEEARALRDKLKKSAKTQLEKSIVEEFDERFTKHEAFLAKKRAENPGIQAADLFDENGIPDTPLLQPATGSDSAADWQRVAMQWTETAEGEFREAECSQAPRAKVRFVTAGEILHLTVRDTHQVEYLPRGANSETAATACDRWKGRKAKIKYRAASVEGEAAEIFSIEFE